MSDAANTYNLVNECEFQKIFFLLVAVFCSTVVFFFVSSYFFFGWHLPATGNTRKQRSCKEVAAWLNLMHGWVRGGNRSNNNNSGRAVVPATTVESRNQEEHGTQRVRWKRKVTNWIKIPTTLSFLFSCLVLFNLFNRASSPSPLSSSTSCTSYWLPLIFSSLTSCLERTFEAQLDSVLSNSSTCS